MDTSTGSRLHSHERALEAQLRGGGQGRRPFRWGPRLIEALADFVSAVVSALAKLAAFIIDFIIGLAKKAFELILSPIINAIEAWMRDLGKAFGRLQSGWDVFWSDGELGEFVIALFDFLDVLMAPMVMIALMFVAIDIALLVLTVLAAPFAFVLPMIVQLVIQMVLSAVLAAVFDQLIQQLPGSVVGAFISLGLPVPDSTAGGPQYNPPAPGSDCEEEMTLLAAVLGGAGLIGLGLLGYEARAGAVPAKNYYNNIVHSHPNARGRDTPGFPNYDLWHDRAVAFDRAEGKSEEAKMGRQWIRGLHAIHALVWNAIPLIALIFGAALKESLHWDFPWNAALDLVLGFFVGLGAVKVFKAKEAFFTGGSPYSKVLWFAILGVDVASIGLTINYAGREIFNAC